MTIREKLTQLFGHLPRPEVERLIGEAEYHVANGHSPDDLMVYEQPNRRYVGLVKKTAAPASEPAQVAADPAPVKRGPGRPPKSRESTAAVGEEAGLSSP